ncbi:hypothetical protein CRG98_024017 [Punica granatum]|uniref:Uncharacterized protein n=1 Tax=Punica granatum TaxID=22663 RepID=A0A2I0JH58_PUNGR|nr:hypothetical protein CRG98_024017 [Punica granatum]
MNRVEDDAGSSKRWPKSPYEKDSKKLPGDMPSLITIPPGPTVALSLKDIQRLVAEQASTEVEGLTQRKVMAAFQKGFRNEDLAKSLVITPPSSFADISTCAWKFMTVEESIDMEKEGAHCNIPMPISQESYKYPLRLIVWDLWKLKASGLRMQKLRFLSTPTYY